MENNGIVAIVRVDRANGAPKLKIEWYVSPDRIREAETKQVARAAADMILKEATA